MPSLVFKQVLIAGLSFLLLIALIVVGYIESVQRIPGAKPRIVVSEDSAKCVDCHQQPSNARTVVQQWRESKHAQKGVGCLECHTAKPEDVDAFEHYTYTIATVVSPKDCSRCHVKEFGQFQGSHHAKGGQILGSLDNLLAEVVEGHMPVVHERPLDSPVAVSGCKQCHGSEVRVMKDDDGKRMFRANGVLMLDPDTWPNTGIGRLNPDGSLGSCAACHNRHFFSVAQAREPDDCGKCHLGPDHPQYEIYRESKHGINFIAHKGDMNLAAQPWVVGKDYVAAPTCATCHMSATPNQPVSHDVGNRISWTLRPAVSERIDAAAIAAGETAIPWETRRENMKDVCHQCHSPQFTLNFYKQYDDLVEAYNSKFGRPATEVMRALRDQKLITSDVEFDEQIEWTFYYLWHHEGRRARMGASMMGPDFTQWHGMFEVADRFYMEFVPDVREVIRHAEARGQRAQAGVAARVLDQVLARDEHRWFTGNMPASERERRKAAAAEFAKRYSGVYGAAQK